MDRHLRFAMDAAAAVTLGSAVCFAVANLFSAPWPVAASIGGLAFVRVFASLMRSPEITPAIGGFEPAPLIFTGNPDAPSGQAPPDAAEQLREALAQLRGAAR